MQTLCPLWKPNFAETRERFRQWWAHRGLLVGAWGPRMLPASESRDAAAVVPPPPTTPAEAYTDIGNRVLRQHAQLARSAFDLDVLPVTESYIGPGDLCLYLGSEPGFEPDTVWYHPRPDAADPESWGTLRFDPECHWWKHMEATLRALVAHSQGRYLVGAPDVIENIDILASLRGSQELLFDMVERPEWVEAKLSEINQAFFAAFQRMYDLIKMDDGSMTFAAFRLWGPGKTAKVQCDAAAMFSPEMFARFVAPALTEQCRWLDYSMFHLDGTQAVCHLDQLLAIPELDAIEWTPQAGIESGGDPRWYPLYRQIKAGGKSIQAIGVKIEEVIPLIEAVGPEGLYILTEFDDEKKVVALEKELARFRSTSR